jgi:putative sterol carrier protein
MQLDKLKVSAPSVLRMIPDDLLAKIASDTKVDYCAKVLKGERLFYLLVYAFLCADRLSQRKLETVFSSQQFKSLFNYSVDMKVSRSSISTRLSAINLDFFEQAYELIYGKFSALYTEKEVRNLNLIRVDSSMVAETCNKLKEGFTVGRKGEGKADRKQIKYTMAYDGFAAKLAEVFSKPTYLSEDKAMPALLERLIKKDKAHRNLYVLDRGLTALDNYKKVAQSEAVFIGRINTNRKMKVVRSLMTKDTDRGLGNLELMDDVIVHLYNNKHEEDIQEFRVVKAKFKVPKDTTRKSPSGSNRKKVEDEVFFITNVTNEPGQLQLTPQEIAEAYRRRWDIEVFYRFLKQNLSFSHFLSTSENGIKVILYMTLITAMLIMIYKRQNGIGFEEAKFCFKMQLEDWIIDLNVAIRTGETDHRKAMMSNRIRIP